MKGLIEVHCILTRQFVQFIKYTCILLMFVMSIDVGW